MGSQSKLGSFVEAWGNVAIGFIINFTANLIFLPMFGFSSLTLEKNLCIGGVFTIISVIRSFVLRRFFNSLRTRWNVNLDQASKPESQPNLTPTA